MKIEIKTPDRETLCKTKNPPDQDRREFLRKSVKLAYTAPLIMTLSVSTASAGYNGAGKCPPGWNKPGNSHYGECG